MPVMNYQYKLRNSAEEHSSHLLRGGSMKSRNLQKYTYYFCHFPTFVSLDTIPRTAEEIFN
jgi:hypothetical protein